MDKLKYFARKKAGGAMPDSNREVKSTTILSRMSVILTVSAGVMLFGLIVFLGVTVNIEIQQSRTDDGFAAANNYVCREVENEDAPIGIIKEYTFTLDEDFERDTYLSFYTVHQ